MSKNRPVIGFITNVTHNINVAGAQGSTSVSMSHPRYWDEGEVWYYLGGEPRDNDTIYRRFPIWHNRNVVAENNYSIESGQRTRKTRLDRYYNFMLGCDAIEYKSNHQARS